MGGATGWNMFVSLVSIALVGAARAADTGPVWTYVDTVPADFAPEGLSFEDVDPDRPGTQVLVEVRVTPQALDLTVPGVRLVEDPGVGLSLPVLTVPRFGPVSFVAPSCGRVWVWGRAGRVAFDWVAQGDGVADWSFPVDPLTVPDCPADADLTPIRGSLGPSRSSRR